MANAESLARLTAGAVNPGAVSGHSTSNETLKGLEFAGALSGISNDAMIYAQAVYMRDSIATHKLLILTHKQAQIESERGKWKVRPSQVKKLAEIALNEVVNKRITADESAKQLGISKAAYLTNWKPKLCKMLMYLNELDGSVRIAISRNS